ncbi:inositol-trisphosphate 3-kinase homolog isoform X1 [Amphibalanus amphitrite]|uniref:inositol-trisphosphate 3-kinase homolog isoform X1 n=1 Tax=Amphibalanus amphitrite TaxID=1232801 RepID=UPI001C8FFFCF|nr:inositol-trisphosphate 3-kinase homolog isoform X1 [Amphibalanus amphitrite]
MSAAEKAPTPAPAASHKKPGGKGQFPPASYSSAFQKLQQTLIQLSEDCKNVDFSRMFQRDERHRDKRPSGAGMEKRGSAAGGGAAPAGKRPSAGGGGGPVAGGPPPHPLTCLGGIQRLAWQSLELAGPVTDIVRMQQANWFQLSGHPGTLALAGPGTLWKKVCVADSAECLAYQSMMNDPHARQLVPKFYSQVCHNGEYFIEMEDLLYRFEDPCVMDIKMGTRTFLESEVKNSTPRADLYKKMVAIDPKAPLPEEHEAGAISKVRYMTYREGQSSSSQLGFRIEGLKMRGSDPIRDLKRIRAWEEVLYTISVYLGSADVARQMLAHLTNIRDKFEASAFFRRHEVIGSSIFLVYDRRRSGAWMIDFAKTSRLPDGQTVDHRSPWQLGNREEGYLTGLDNLCKVVQQVERRLSGSSHQPRPGSTT